MAEQYVRMADDDAAVREAAERLRLGGLVAFPAETVYGLGADARNPLAVAQIFAVKGRPAQNPLIVHVADVDAAKACVTHWPPVATQLAERFWPGPLTLVLPRHATIPDAVTGGGPTVAIRVPAHPVALKLLQLSGVAIAAPSANRSGELSPTTAAHVLASLGDRVDCILDGGPTTAGVESTVVDLTSTPPRILRPGPISASDLEPILGALAPIDAAANLATEGALPSPGLLRRHYAPRTALELAETEADQEFLANLYETAGLRVARWKPAATAAETMSQLYAQLHQYDDQGYDRIIAQLPDATPEWDAVRDRLTRAAAEE
jgi:L-threonylcarbamoyladenylate synthase